MPNKCWCGNEDLIEYSPEYSRCDACHTLVSKHEINEDIYSVQNEKTDFYGAHYWKHEMLEMAQVANLEELVKMYFKERAAYWLRYFLKYLLPPAAVAEIGGGLGQFSYLLKQASFSEICYELSPEICAYARETLGVNMIAGDFLKADGLYDCIVAFDLLEHILEPESLIASMADKSHEDGLVCLQTPCYDDALGYDDMLKEKPRFAELLRPEQHIYLFSRSSVERLLRTSGFPYIAFEPAVFGDDYDMFLFASKKPLHINSSREINADLCARPNGYLLNALLDLNVDMLAKQREFIEVQQRCLIMSEQTEKRLADIETLTELIARAEKEKEGLHRQIKDKDYQLEKSWEAIAVASSGLENISKQLQITNEQAEQRLADVHTLHRIVEDLQTELDKKGSKKATHGGNFWMKLSRKSQLL
jgi:2-polyprenyl-3-methyl-5-hydroxy-6-metoxy-1,4-benzoquinol methylase